MNLIIISRLSCNEGLFFRYVTMIAKKELKYEVLLETEKEKVDYYFRLLKRKGWFDFVDDFIVPELKEEGIRLDDELNYPKTICIKNIDCQNTLHIVGQLKLFKEI